MSDAQDAARYRWLRKNRHMDIAAAWILPVDAPMPESEDEMDAAIDAAMREDAAKSERAAENEMSVECPAALAASWQSDGHHVWRTQHFQDEYPRDSCIYCGVDRGDYEHDLAIIGSAARKDGPPERSERSAPVDSSPHVGRGGLASPEQVSSPAAATPLANAAADTRTRGRRRNDATDQSV